MRSMGCKTRRMKLAEKLMNFTMRWNMNPESKTRHMWINATRKKWKEKHIISEYAAWYPTIDPE